MLGARPREPAEKPVRRRSRGGNPFIFNWLETVDDDGGQAGTVFAIVGMGNWIWEEFPPGQRGNSELDMCGSTLAIPAVDEDLAVAAGREAGVDGGCVCPFGDFTRLMEELLKLPNCASCALISAGHCTAEVALAASRADVRLTEALGYSPFTGNVTPALKAVREVTNILYTANPNLITGATFTPADIERLCTAVPKGKVIVDERLISCGGDTATPLLDSFANLVILRSFQALRGSSESSAGFVVASRDVISAIRQSGDLLRISRIAREKVLCEELGGGDRVARQRQISHESLRIATELTRLGIQCRTTSADFLLIRVANVKDTGNFLTANQVAIENLDGYPQMRHYLRFRLESPGVNDGLVDAFRKMPHECYRGSVLGKRIVKRSGRADTEATGWQSNCPSDRQSPYKKSSER